MIKLVQKFGCFLGLCCILYGTLSCEFGKDSETVANEILESVQTRLNTLEGDELFSLSQRIITRPDLFNDTEIDSFFYFEIERVLTGIAWGKINHLAEEGNAKAQFTLGMYYAGYDFCLGEWYTSKNDKGLYNNSNIDIEKSIYWYHKAAMQGVGYANNDLKCCFGHSNNANIEEDIKWYKSTIWLTGGYSERVLGDLYMFGYEICDGDYWTKTPNAQNTNYDEKIGYRKTYNFKTIISEDVDSAMHYWSMAEYQGNKTATKRILAIEDMFDDMLEDIDDEAGLHERGRPARF